MRRHLTSALLFGLTVAACGGGETGRSAPASTSPASTTSGGTTSGGTTPAGTTSPGSAPGAPPDAAESATALTELVAEQLGADLPRAEYDCVVTDLQAEFDPTELAAATRLTTDAAAADRYVERIGSVFDACLTADTLTTVLFDQFVDETPDDESVASCMASELGAQLAISDLLLLATAPITGTDTTDLEAMLAATAEDCGLA